MRRVLPLRLFSLLATTTTFQPIPLALAKCRDRGCRLTVVRHGNPPLIGNYCIYCFPWLYFRPHPFCSQDILTYPQVLGCSFAQSLRHNLRLLFRS